ncbi:MAG: hypothetical protein V8S24_03515 [Gordonibacter pamelaeae]
MLRGARATTAALSGAPYTGAWQVAARALSYDFLWNEVRVKGGAYGAGFGATRTGDLRFYSYRDPHLDETLARFAASAPGSRRSTRSPRPDGGLRGEHGGRASTRRSRPARWRGARTATSSAAARPRRRLKTRAEMVAADPQAVRALGAPLADAVAHDAVCTFGSKDIIEAARTPFEVVDLLNE